MNKKAMMSFCILTVLAVLFVSFLLITVGPPVRSAGGSCHIFPDSAAARLEHCSTCESANTEAYLPKNDCTDAINQCGTWIQFSECSEIKVCGAVCNDQALIQQWCTVTPPAGGAAAAVKGVWLANGKEVACPCPSGGVCGEPAPSNVTLFGGCDFDPNNLESSDKQCKGDYICCRPASMLSSDGVCERDENGKCDPDCPLEIGKYDPDCIKGKCIVPADLDRNCKVDIIDIARIAKVFGCNEQGNTPCGKWSSPKFT